MNAFATRLVLAALGVSLFGLRPAPALAWPAADLGAQLRGGLHLVAECPGEAVPPGTLAAYVRGIQQELAVHGYDAGPDDGVPGAKTRAAIRQYQRDAGLAVDGCASRELLDHLNFILPKVNRPRSANADPLVIEAQTLLTRRGYYLGPVDGMAGLRTRAAVRRFQGDARLVVDGVIDRALVDQIKVANPELRGDAGGRTGRSQ